MPRDPLAPHHKPLPRSLAVFGCLVAGFTLARGTGIGSVVWLALAAAACTGAALTSGRSCKAFLCTAAMAVFAGWFTLRLFETPADSLLRLTPDGPVLVTIEGVMLGPARAIDRGPDPLNPQIPDEPRLRATVSVRSVETDRGFLPATGRLWVSAKGGPAAADLPRAGERVRLTGMFTPVSGPVNPGEPDRRLWAGQDGYVGWLRTQSLDGAAIDGAGFIDRVWGVWLGWQAGLDERAHRLLFGDEERPRGEDGRAQGRALLAALILGDEEPALKEVRGAFNRLGLAHILSISGFHLAVLAFVTLLALRLVGDLGWLEPALVAALVLAYLAVLPFNAPVWRSGLMVLGLLTADALGRRHDRLSTLAWIAILLLLWRPMDLWSIGFQLSFGLVALLIRAGDVFHAKLFGIRLRGVVRPVRGFWGRRADEALDSGQRLISTNILCCLAATPVVMYHTGLVSPLSVLTGVVMVPLITVLLIAGYAAAGVGVLVPAATPWAAAFLEHASGALACLARWIDGIPGTSARVPPVSLAWTVAATALAVYWMGRGWRRERWLWAAAAGVALWAGAEFWLGQRLPGSVVVRVDTLAVGDGTCELVRCGGDAVLWDCGSLSPGVGQLTVPRAARALDVWRTPVAVVTHPNVDHFNGLLDVVEPLGIREVVVGEEFARHAAEHTRSPEAYVLAELSRRGVRVRVVSAGDVIQSGRVRLQVLSPPKGERWTLDNDMSLVAEVRTGNGPAAVLMTGDIQDQAIASLEATNPSLKALILEAPHHGSARPAAYEFVERLGPRIVLQSTGAKRAEDPRWAAGRAGRVWRCTATEGAVWAEVLTDGRARSGVSAR